ncbi:PREDICTED: probable ubiquitin-conjugating enzyme E2 25 [Prunus mume]|uniref:Probable ubiquitin-conjugating enzyme E2 25 n=1 Tax=Prunus mume TaxID=102107 RepID=A0ABM0NE16_PRUMU|nr:PREDICTED: probable ubiquitin-conjugating enzyme E2 25 [Prunus mume]
MAPSSSSVTPKTTTSKPNVFKRFDVVSDHSDHHYVNNRNGCCGGGRVQKKIMQEWKILEKHLPDSIYVRAYETRIDLLRAVVVGASGTPYHDALFFFDIAFPFDYPTHPPEGKEKWDPSQSTILQVLVSIQGLVLNKEPYFNEPGTGNRFGCEASRAYNEKVFVLTCKTTLYLLSRAPLNFKAFTAAFYRQRAGVILRACRAYANGRVVVGHYKDEDAGVAVTKVKRKFVASMVELYPQLFKAFQGTGASLEGLLEHLTVETRYPAPSKPRGKCIVKRAFDRLKTILGLGGSKKKTKEGEENENSNNKNDDGTNGKAGVAAAAAAAD